MILPPLNTLQAFEAAARLNSLSRAGDELHVTHAAVSGQIKKLEEWAGRRLFERSGRGISLTPAGEELLKTVQPALLTISATAQSLRIHRDRKLLKVACIPSLATRWLIPALPRFSAIYPHVTIEVTYSHANEPFNPERHDVLITHQDTTSDKLSSTLIFSRINKPVASPRYIEQSKCDAELNHATLLHDEVISAWEEWFEKAGYRPQGLIHGPVYQDFNLLATAVIAGHGVALCPIEVFRRELAHGDLMILSDVSTLADEGYYLIHDKNCNKATRAFSAWFPEACSLNKPGQPDP
ncbi:glycine cleavage system transcriptional activator GcvA (plasmid) [Sinorhizobium americanum CCGM7]|uniref:LysR substrate-binding domain-containing protein n=1 Tax=Sinorhizobium americanum TaxID=194963 RepID=UPI00055BD7E0|nr:LysR substrate-binding domain-containing protein [Sinorhizobium americanum]APG86956.1 glycine cleavage system transcriptional activator GcvA [Sinorhizobium americanum CCGM7]